MENTAVLNIQSFGEITYNGQAVLVENDSGDFSVSLNTAASVFELRFASDMTKSILIASMKDPYVDAEPYISIAVEREQPSGFRVAMIKDGKSPTLVRGFGFWFIATRLKICQDNSFKNAL